MGQTAIQQDEGDHRQIGLGLAAAGGEPDQIHRIPPGIGLVLHGTERQQQKAELKGAPAGLPCPASMPHLPAHGLVGPLKGPQAVLIATQQIDATAHALDRRIDSSEDAPRRGLLRHRQIPQLTGLPFGPARIGIDEGIEGIQQTGRIGAGSQIIQRQGLFIQLGVVRRDPGHFGARQKIRIQPPDPARSISFPVHRRAMPDAMDLVMPVLQLQFLLLVAHQQRILARVRQYLAPNQLASQLRFKQDGGFVFDARLPILPPVLGHLLAVGQ